MAQVKIKAMENGPCVVEIDGKVVTALCRCGASNTKPQCDGSHQKIGFKAKAATLEF